jgi:hypothetical protein
MREPLTESGLDLRDFPYMPLDVVRLRDSESAILSSGEEFRAAVILWCAAWHQVPAASLPNDDRLLANLAGFGRDVEAWKALREGALRGFVQCSDGRLYHPVIAEKAKEADQKRRSQRKRTEAATASRKDTQERNVEMNNKRNVDVTLDVTLSKGREGKGEEENKDSRRVIDPTSDDFEEFWKAYPKRKGDNPRKSALKAFNSAVRAGADPKEIIAGVRLAAARNADKIGTEFIPQAVKWLRDERWKDHLARAPDPPRAEVDWPALVSTFKRTGIWPANFGPQPGFSGCRAPPATLSEQGYSSVAA